jgi:Carboxypeptidase regulatory-like domain
MRAYTGLIVFSLLGCAVPGDSQQPLVGSIQGTITDLHDAPIPYAGLTATNIDSVEPESHRQTTGADKQGSYQFVEVPPGRYSIVVKKNGYRDYTIPLVTVRDGETVRMPAIKMSALANH